MSGVGLKVVFEKRGKGFAKVQEAIHWAVANGLNEGGRLVFTQVRRGLKTQVNPKAYRTITSRTYAMAATPESLVFTIVVKGKPIPIKEFPVRRVAAGVEAAPWGLTRTFQRSYQEKNGSGGYIPNAWRARLTQEREPVRVLLGPNLAKEMLGITRHNGRMPRLFSDQAALLVPPALLKLLGRAMGV